MGAYMTARLIYKTHIQLAEKCATTEKQLFQLSLFKQETSRADEPLRDFLQKEIKAKGVVEKEAEGEGFFASTLGAARQLARGFDDTFAASVAVQNNPLYCAYNNDQASNPLYQY